jgi:hypothetical protein
MRHRSSVLIGKFTLVLGCVSPMSCRVLQRIANNHLLSAAFAAPTADHLQARYRQDVSILFQTIYALRCRETSEQAIVFMIRSGHAMLTSPPKLRRHGRFVGPLGGQGTTEPPLAPSLSTRPARAGGRFSEKSQPKKERVSGSDPFTLIPTLLGQLVVAVTRSVGSETVIIIVQGRRQ